MSIESDIAAYKRRKQTEKARTAHETAIAKESKYIKDLRRHIKRKWEVEG